MLYPFCRLDDMITAIELRGAAVGRKYKLEKLRSRIFDSRKYLISTKTVECVHEIKLEKLLARWHVVEITTSSMCGSLATKRNSTSKLLGGEVSSQDV